MLNIGLPAIVLLAVPVSVLICIPEGLLVEAVGFVCNVLLLGTICAFNTFCNKLAGMLANDPICTVGDLMLDNELDD